MSRGHSVMQLYQVPPSEFVRERNALVARLRTAGRASEAAELAKLRRPTPALWAVNHVAHAEPAEVKRLIEATQALKLVQLGRGKDVDAVATRQRNALQNLVTRARAALQTAGLGASPVVLRRISATFLGAAAEPRSHALLGQGRLTQELAAPGFEIFGGMTPRPRPPTPATREHPSPPSESSEAAESRTATRAPKREASVLRRRVETLEREARRRRRRAERTEKVVAALRNRLHAADQRLAEERRQAHDAEREAAQAREQLARTEASRGR